jgi:prepilin-type N-terminal cleavage/methylation domain-containing protein
MRLIRDERGFTLPELMTTMAIAIIVSLATFALIEVVMKRSGEVAARVDTVQRGRTTMDQITRQLRSQVCALRSDDPTMAGPRSVNDASETSVGVYADFSSEALVAGATPPPTLGSVGISGDALVETVTPGKWLGSKVSFSYTGVTPVARPLITKVALYTPEGASKPVPLFRYYRFNNANPPQPAEEIVATGNRQLTDDELESVARISVSFRVLTATGKTTGSAVFQNDVYVRTADPNALIPMPTCLTTS